MAIDLIEARKDLRNIRATSVFYNKKESSNDVIKNLNKAAFPANDDKVFTFDDIEKALGQG